MGAELLVEIAGVFGVGTLTMLTPCVLPLIPIYLAILGGAAADVRVSRLWLLLNTLAFSSGLVLIFVALGLTATSLGSLLADHRGALLLGGGLLVILFGLKFLGVLRIPGLDQERRVGAGVWKSRYRPVNSFLMGIVFSLGWTPCVGPVLGSVLTYTASTNSDPLRGAALLAAYGLGFVAPLIIVSLAADGARRLVARLSGWMPRMERASGLLMTAVGLYMVVGAATALAGAPDADASLAKAPAGAALGLDEPASRPRIVEFSSAECAICQKMKPTVDQVERECAGRQVELVKVDLSDGGNLELARRFGVRGVPTFLFLDPHGVEVSRLVGYQTLESLRHSVATLTGQRCASLVPPGPSSVPAGAPGEVCSGSSPAFGC